MHDVRIDLCDRAQKETIMKPDLPNGVLTLTGAASKYKTSLDKILKYCADGMPVWQAGNITLVKEIDLQEWIARSPKRTSRRLNYRMAACTEGQER